jgi:hypothetical protein
MPDTAAPTDVSSQVVRSHRRVQELFAQFDLYDDTSAVNLIRDLFAQIRRGLSVHAVAEEQVLYPPLRAHVPGGAKLADAALADHHQVAETLVILDRLEPRDPGFLVGVRALAGSVGRHMGEEERELLPLFEQHLSAEQQQELARAFQAAETVAPTRPHPDAPQRPPANIVVGLATSLLDRARDAVDAVKVEGQRAVERHGGSERPTRT